MDWFLYDRNLRHERVDQSEYYKKLESNDPHVLEHVRL